MAQPLFGSPRGIGRTQSYDSKAAVLAFVRFGSMLLKKSVFANEQFFSRGAGALIRKLCGRPHDHSDFQPVAFMSSI
jgi:hypothetical protein